MNRRMRLGTRLLFLLLLSAMALGISGCFYNPKPIYPEDTGIKYLKFVAATGKMTTDYGDYYLKETLGEFVEQFSSDDFKVIIFDANNNTYTVDDLDTVVTTDWVGVNIIHSVTFVCEITAEKIDGVKLRDCRITDFITKEGTTSVEINNITVKLGETTKDDLISYYGNYESKDEESFGYIRFNLSEYELNSYSYKLNDDKTVRFITVDASPFI